MAKPKNPKKRSSHDADGGQDSEREFLERYDAADFPAFAVTVDVALLCVREGHLHALLVKRAEHPFRGRWALPGGFCRLDESLEAAARRVLSSKARLEHVFVEQLYTFGQPGRDPRTRVVSVAFVALVDEERFAAAALDGDLSVARLVVPWEGETGGPVEVVDARGETLPQAFDHADILGMAVRRLRGKLDYTPVGFQLLPEAFTLRQLQEIHETVLGRALNKDSFRRRMLASGLLEATGEKQEDVDYRPAELYRFGRRSAL